VNAPAGAACSSLAMPLEWLHGLVIIDLPGLGSISESHREYTLSQIQMADVIVYLLSPRGPSQDDMETISLIRRYGKRLLLGVAQWDKIEQAVRDGEKEPDLKKWSADIEQKTGDIVRLYSVSKYGRGRQALLNFFDHAKAEISAIRNRRFCTEAQAVLQGALQQNKNGQETCLARSEAEIQHLHNKYITSRQTMIDLKSELYEKQNQDRKKLEVSSRQIVSAAKQGLQDKLDSTRSHFIDSVNESGEQIDAYWDEFKRLGADSSNDAVAGAAVKLSELSTYYGKLEIPGNLVSEFNVTLPEPEQIELDDFLNVSRLKQLESTLTAHQTQKPVKEQKALVPVSKKQDQLLADLIKRKNEIQFMPLPTVIKEIEGSGKWATYGRTIGEIADLALIVIDPPIIGAKIASLIGRGAKSASLAKTVTNVTKVARSAQMGNKVHPAIKKLGMLEMLSLGYWGEKLGTMLGDGPKVEEIIDPDALAEQQLKMLEIESQIQACQQKLSKLSEIESERILSDWAMEQNKKERARAESQIEELRQEARSAMEQAKMDAARRYNELIRQQADNAIHHWLRNFDLQSRTMQEMLFARCKRFWEEQVEQTLSDRQHDMEALSQQLKKAPEEKQQILERLKRQMAQLESAAAMLNA